MANMNRPNFRKDRREDLADAGIPYTANFEADVGHMHRVDVSGDHVTCTFPNSGQVRNAASCMFGVLVTATNGGNTNRLSFSAGDQTVSFILADFRIGDSTSDRPEFLIFQKLGDIWYVVNDGRARVLPA